MCYYNKWDYFEEIQKDKTLEDWVFLYVTIASFNYDHLMNIDLPLAETSGEIAGALMNPEGYKEYKKSREIREKLERGESGHSSDSQGGYAYSSAKLEGKDIVDSEGNLITTTDDLEEKLNQFD